MKNKIRIDKLLVERGFCESRNKAVQIIQAASVFVDTVQVKKVSEQYYQDVEIKIYSDEKQWVSRGALKLLKALEFFHIDPKDFVCMDIGASTGGFTEVLLENDAAKVYAVDVGKDQLHKSLREDERVVNLEKTNIRELSEKQFPEKVDLIVTDVSFISLTLVLPEMMRFLKKEGKIIALIKPQFEVGKENLGKGGVVKDAKLHKQAIEKVRDCAKEFNLQEKGFIKSPVLGGDGNKEFLIYFTIG